MTGKRRFEVDSTVYYWSTRDGKALKGKVARVMREGDGLPAEAGMYVLTTGKTICGEDLYEKRQDVRERQVQAPALAAGSTGALAVCNSGALAAGSNGALAAVNSGALAAGDSRALVAGSNGALAAGDSRALATSSVRDTVQTGADEKRQRIEGGFEATGIDEFLDGRTNRVPPTPDQ